MQTILHELPWGWIAVAASVLIGAQIVHRMITTAGSFLKHPAISRRATMLHCIEIFAVVGVLLMLFENIISSNFRGEHENLILHVTLLIGSVVVSAATIWAFGSRTTARKIKESAEENDVGEEEGDK